MDKANCFIYLYVQYIVDVMAKLISERLICICSNQQEVDDCHLYLQAFHVNQETQDAMTYV